LEGQLNLVAGHHRNVGGSKEIEGKTVWRLGACGEWQPQNSVYISQCLAVSILRQRTNCQACRDGKSVGCAGTPRSASAKIYPLKDFADVAKSCLFESVLQTWRADGIRLCRH
jgi:hypothetical protein